MTAVQALADELSERGFGEARLALVLGSGLGDFAQRLEGARRLPYGELEHMPRSAVPGHAGEWVAGTLAGVPVLIQSGRVHLYEGRPVATVTRAVRAFAALGCRGVVLTNAAGGLHADWPPGTLMRLTDHVNLTGRAPLVLPRGSGPRVGSPYDADLGQALDRAAAEAGVTLRHGVYAGQLGPAYETPAEVRMARWLGADAVGMSTVAEASAAAEAGLAVAAISCITNHAAGLTDQPLSHEEVVAVGAAVAEDFARLLAAAVPLLDAAVSC